MHVIQEILGMVNKRKVIVFSLFTLTPSPKKKSLDYFYPPPPPLKKVRKLSLTNIQYYKILIVRDEILKVSDSFIT